MKNILILIACTILFTNCKKTKVNYTINGQFVKCVNGVEIAVNPNIQLQLFQKNFGSNSNAKVLAIATSDAQGKFSFNYETNNIDDKLTIRSEGLYGFVNYMEEIPIKGLTDLKIISGTYNLAVNINVTKPYTNLDTLYYVKQNSTSFNKLAGPFNSGRLFTQPNTYHSKILSYQSTEATLRYKINNPINLFEDKIYSVPNTSLCNNDTVYVNIDIK